MNIRNQGHGHALSRLVGQAKWTSWRMMAWLRLQSLLSAIRQTPTALYLLIDEYDNFANEVMVSPGWGCEPL